MRKLLLLLPVLLFVIAGCNQAGQKADLSELKKNLQTYEGKESTVEVTELEDLSSELPGFSFVNIKVSKDNVTSKDVFAITNGRFIVESDIDTRDMSSLDAFLRYKHDKNVQQLDVSKLTFVSGNKDSKNIIVEVTDFQCPYCNLANDFIKEQLKDKKDYALYIMHNPLTEMHPSAQIMAQIYEAGKLLNHDFKDDLFKSDYITELENKAKALQDKGVTLDREKVEKLVEEVNHKIVEDFAAKTTDAAKFKELVNSDEVKSKVQNCKDTANTLGVGGSTPSFFINGKNVASFNPPLLTKILSTIK